MMSKIEDCRRLVDALVSAVEMRRRANEGSASQGEYDDIREAAADQLAKLSGRARASKK
jgi:hypothetical protein